MSVWIWWPSFFDGSMKHIWYTTWIRNYNKTLRRFLCEYTCVDKWSWIQSHVHGSLLRENSGIRLNKTIDHAGSVDFWWISARLILLTCTILSMIVKNKSLNNHFAIILKISSANFKIESSFLKIEGSIT